MGGSIRVIIDNREKGEHGGQYAEEREWFLVLVKLENELQDPCPVPIC
jgi:hypothetical protein